MNKYGIINIILFVAVALVLNCTVAKPLPPEPDLQGQNQNLCALGFNCVLDDMAVNNRPCLVYKVDDSGNVTAKEFNPTLDGEKSLCR